MYQSSLFDNLQKLIPTACSCPCEKSFTMGYDILTALFLLLFGAMVFWLVYEIL